MLHIFRQVLFGAGNLEIFTTKYRELAELENELFLVGHFEFKKNKPENFQPASAR